MANQNKLKKYHFVYKTVNLVNGKYYIGVHSTSNLKDGYLGSGTQLRRAIRKYGKGNFTIEILEYHLTRELLYEREREIVTKKVINDPLCMNLKMGGIGGWPPTAKQRFLEKMKNVDFKKMFGQRASERNLKQYEEGKRKRKQVLDWTGKKHKPESIKKMKESKKGQGTGNTNSQYGTMWITNEIENKKIKTNLQIPEGWHKGRT